MAKIERPGGKKNRKHGRAARKPKTARYNLSHRRERNKIKRIIRSNGMAFARQWARDRGILHFLPKVE